MPFLMPGVLCVVDVQEKVDNVLAAAADDDNGKADDDDNGKADDDDISKETPFVSLIGDDAKVQFGPAPPPPKQPRNYIPFPTFGKQASAGRRLFRRGFTFKAYAKKPAPSKKKRRCVLCCPHPCVHTLTLVIVQDCERFEQGGAQEAETSQA
jgi:hypothetical protein